MMPIYDKAYFVKTAIWWSLIIAVGYFTKSLDYLLAFPLVCYAVSSRRANFLAFLLLLMTAVQCANHMISPKTVLYLYIQRGSMLLFGAVFAIKLATSGKNSIFTPFTALVIYVFYMILPSLNGWSPIISILKIVLFICTFSVLVGISKAIVESQEANILKLRSIIVAYALVMFGYSIVLLRFPNIGYMSMADMTNMEIAIQLEEGISLFKGMTQHSQSLGPVAALSIVLIAGDYIFGVRKKFWPYNIALMCAIVCLWKSGSRTAMVACMFGVGLLFFAVVNGAEKLARWKRVVLGFFTQMFIVGLLMIVLVPRIRGSVLRFTVKYDTGDVPTNQITLADVTSSRIGALDNPLHNWRESPIFGNGFQVSSEMGMLRDVPIKEILTAPVEKGTWVVAILEEGGIVGMALFLAWVFIAGSRLWRQKAYIGFAALMTLLTINLGEFCLFSLTSTGCLLWALTLFAMIMDAIRLKEQRRYAYIAYN